MKFYQGLVCDYRLASGTGQACIIHLLTEKPRPCQNKKKSFFVTDVVVNIFS